MSFGVQSILRRLMTGEHVTACGLAKARWWQSSRAEDVRAAGAQGYFLQRYQAANAAASSSLRARAIASIVNNFTMIMQPLVTVAMLIWGVILIQDGHISSGALIGAVMFAGRDCAIVVSGDAGRAVPGARAAMRTLNDLMAIPTERDPEKRYLSRPTVQGQLPSGDVSFAYPKGNRQHAPHCAQRRLARDPPWGAGWPFLARSAVADPPFCVCWRICISQRMALWKWMESTCGRSIRWTSRTHVGFVSQRASLFQGTLEGKRDVGAFARQHGAIH